MDDYRRLDVLEASASARVAADELARTSADADRQGGPMKVDRHRPRCRAHAYQFGATPATDDEAFLHIVVDAAPGHAAERGECTGMRIEQHLVTLRGIGNEPERAAGIEFDVGDLQASPQAANNSVFAAPVKLEGFAGFEGEWRVGLSARRGGLLLVPAPNKRADAAVAAGITLAADRLEHEPRGAPVTLWPMTIRPYSFNLDGANIYMTLAVLFLAQATNIHLTTGQEATLLAVTMLTSKGSSAVVGAGFVALAASLAVVPTVPAAAMVLILGIDRFMAECRSLVNFIGNAVAVVVVSAWEGELDRSKMNAVLHGERSVVVTDEDVAFVRADEAE